MSEETQLNRASQWHRRKFLRGMAAMAGLSLSAVTLAACGDTPTSTSAPTTAAAVPTTTSAAATTSAATTAAIATTAVPTTVATTVAATTAATTSAPTTAARTTTAATTSAPTTAATTTSAPTTTRAATTNAATTAAAASAPPAGFTEVGKLSAAREQPASFSVDGKKGFVYAKSPTEVVAYSNICTHQGCEVGYETADKKFGCPCHGSQFDPRGEVVQGPARVRLPLFENRVIGDIIYARLS